jgi:hypothetical protein
VDSFQQFLFRDEARISRRASESKRCPQMAYFLASDQASFIKSAGEPVFDVEASYRHTL